LVRGRGESFSHLTILVRTWCTAIFEKEKKMSDGSGAKEIVLGDELGDITVKANGVRVEIHTDGSIVAYTKSDVDAYTNGAVHVHAAANDDGTLFPSIARPAHPATRDKPLSSAPSCAGPDNSLNRFAPSREGDVSRLLSAAKAEPQIGDRMADGTVFAGISPDTNKPMYVAPEDAPGTYTFNEAAKYAKNLDAHGHHDFHAPSKGELDVLWENRNKGKLKGTFNETGSYPAGWYWSSSQDGSNYAWSQCFSGGSQDSVNKSDVSSLRCVR
jgi:hypothetical protein